MTKFADIFYIFSKFITSLILFVLLSITLYALYRSYVGVDNIASEVDDRLNKITKNIENNLTVIVDFEKKITENKNLLKNVTKNFHQKKYEEKITKLENDNNTLLQKLEKLTESINNLRLDKNLNTKIENNNNFNDNNKQILSLKKIILTKYKAGENFAEELELLENVSPKTPKSIFEKLYMYQVINFYGTKNLNVDFNKSLERYIKHSIQNKNQNFIISFLLQYINIKPRDLSVYENFDLNILMRAKNYLENKEYQDSLNQVLSLEDTSINFFKLWIDQMGLFIEFNHHLSKVV